MSAQPAMGFYIRELRQARGLSVRELGAACGVSEEQVLNWEVNFAVPDDTEAHALQATLRRHHDTASRDWRRHRASIQHIVDKLEAKSPRGPLRDGQFWLKAARELMGLAIDMASAGAHAGHTAPQESLSDVCHAMRAAQTALVHVGKYGKLGDG